MDKLAIKEALETINNAILELNDGDTTGEDFYWWNATLNLFDYQIDESGNIIPEKRY